MFYTGQKVVCIEGTCSECGVLLRQQDIYEVKNIWKCNCSTVLDVGLKITTDDKCFKCNTLLSTDGTWWLYAKRFIPLEEWKHADETIQKLIKEIQVPAPSIHSRLP